MFASTDTPAPTNAQDRAKQIEVAATVWHCHDGIVICEASMLQGYNLAFMHPVQRAEVIRIPRLSRMNTTLMFAFHFQPIRDRENDILFWEARANGYIFRIFND